MGRKYFKILTILFVVFSPLFVIPAAADNVGEFPFDGGTTTDGIVVSQPYLSYFYRYKSENCYMPWKKRKSCYIMFNVKVPKGKEAGFCFNRFLNVVTSGGTKRNGVDMSLVVECDGKPLYCNSWNEKISSRGVEVVIPEGEHEMKLDFSIKRDYAFSGSINDLALHVHEYGDTIVLRVPLCGQKGQKIIQCRRCQKQKSFDIIPEYTKHSSKQTVIKKFSCMNTASTITWCEHCSYTVDRKSVV